MLPVPAPVLTTPLCNRNLNLDSLLLEDSNWYLMSYSRFCNRLMLENFTELLIYSYMVTGETGLVVKPHQRQFVMTIALQTLLCLKSVFWIVTGILFMFWDKCSGLNVTNKQKPNRSTGLTFVQNLLQWPSHVFSKGVKLFYLHPTWKLNHAPCTFKDRVH